MTDRFALDVRGATLWWRASRTTSVEAVKAAANIVDARRGAHAAAQGRRRATRALPVPRGEDAVVLGLAATRHVPLLRLRQAGGDAISFVRETESLDFVGAIEWLADRFSVPLEYEEASPQADGAAQAQGAALRAARAGGRVLRAVLWARGGQAVREYLASRGLGEEVCREFRLGLSPGGRDAREKAREKGFTREELAAAGLVNRRGTDYFQRRLMFPLTDARGRVIGFQARKLHEDDPLRGKYVNSPESELFHKSQRPLRAPPRAAGDREGGPRASSSRGTRT